MNRATRRTFARVGSMCALSLCLLACGPPRDSQTAALAATVGLACSSAHDCGSNQRCVQKRCELDDGACIKPLDCGSRNCNAGFCGLPAPAELSNQQTSFDMTRATPDKYLASGNDGFVDARGGLVLAMRQVVDVRAQQIWWQDWQLSNWRAENADAVNWRPLLADNLFPERFIWRHKATGAVLAAYARPLPTQERAYRTAPLKRHVTELEDALIRGLTFENAITLTAQTGAVASLERTVLKADRIGSFEALRFETLRTTKVGGERIRVLFSRMEFGDLQYVIVVGLAAPIDDYTSLLDDFGDFVGFVRGAGVDANVGLGVD